MSDVRSAPLILGGEVVGSQMIHADGLPHDFAGTIEGTTVGQCPCGALDLGMVRGPPPLTFAYVGNFGAPHSTENEIAKAIVDAGHLVIPIQENVVDHWRALAAGKLHVGAVSTSFDDIDVLLWTRTGWDWPALGIGYDEMRALQWQALSALAKRGVPAVGYHLDRWWGLDREHQVVEEPFFRCDLVVTADGGHDGEWARAGVRHHWLPPAVSRFECQLGTARERWRGEVVFVGSWRPGYHPEWAHRQELVRWLRSKYGRRTRFWPQPHKPAVRGDDLRDLYASSAVVVGDSCLAGDAHHYWSDRIPETLGRGGFLLHPYVDGLDEHFAITHWGGDAVDVSSLDVTHLVTWDAGDWWQLKQLIDHYLAHPDQRARIAAAGRAHVLEHHTYTVRVRQLVDILTERALIR